MSTNSSYIHELILNNFRSYQTLTLNCNQLPILIIGNNGAGKTNILEAISLLSPGKGMRSAKLQDIGYNNSENWALNATILNTINQNNIGIGYQDNKKIIKINHQNQNKQVELTKIVNIIWLTPQMDTIFLNSRKQRLNFFDRIVFSFDNQHANNISLYEHNKQERARLLRNKILDTQWLSILENKMAEIGLSIARSRINIIEELQQLINKSPFENVKIMMNGDIEELIKSNNSSNIQEIFCNCLKEKRTIDALSKRTNYGVHKSNFQAHNIEKDIVAELCSTGEQKLMLIAITLAATKQDTVLLLDDIASHLDQKNRNTLLSVIIEKKCQVWLTDTNQNNFTDFEQYMQVFHI